MSGADPRSHSCPGTCGLRVWAAIALLGFLHPSTWAARNGGAIAGRVISHAERPSVAGIEVTLEEMQRAPGAALQAAARAPANPRVTQTDSHGGYRFDDVPPGVYRLRFEGPECAARAIAGIRVRAGEELRVDSAPEPALQERVTVSGRRAGDGAGPSQATFGRGDLESRPAALQDPFRALGGRAGIAQESDFKSEMRIRGGEASDTAVLLDGQPLPYAYHFGGSAGSAGTLSADLVDEIQVSTGGFSVEYGDALAGVIDLSTRPRDPGTITGTAGVGSLLAHAAVSGPAGDGSWTFAGRMSDLGLYDERAAGDGLDGAAFRDLFAALRQPLPGGARLEAALLAAGNGYEAALGGTGRATIASRHGGARLRLEAPLDSRTLLRLQIAGGDLSVGSSVRGGMSFDQDQANQEVGVSVLRLLGRAHRLHGGAVFERTRGGMKGTVSDGPGLVASVLDYDAARTGAFVEETWRPGDTVSLRYGVRIDRSSWSGEQAVSPRASLAIQPRGGLTLRCAAGRFVQFPRQEQVFLAAGEPLRRQVADHFIAGIEKSWRGGLRVVVEGYRKDLHDPIGEAVNRAIELPELLTRYDSGRVRGAEITIEQAAAGSWRWEITYGHLVATQEKSGIESPRNTDERHRASLLLGKRFGRGWEAGGAFRYASGLPYTPLLPFTSGLAHTTVLGELNSARLPAYHRLDLRLSRLVPVAWGQLGVHVDLLNVYNQANVRSVDLYFEPADGAYYRTTAYQSPFLPVVAVSAEF
ncbi:MAG: TonB-dependent receptor [Acidobacteria bacterium]|nr:TonB-dependent receptor [Acidobacteriota bacterium]